MAGSERQSRLFVLGAAGVAVFTIGVVVACLRLPEWRNRSVPAESFFTARLQQLAGPAGLRIESAPRVQLRSKSVVYENGALPQRETAYEILGPRAAGWLAREGRGPFVEVSARSRWPTWSESGQLRVIFSLRGVPLSAIWIPDDLFHFPVTATGPPRLDLDRLFLPPVRREPDVELHVLGETIRLSAVPGSSPPESLIRTVIGAPVAPMIELDGAGLSDIPRHASRRTPRTKGWDSAPCRMVDRRMRRRPVAHGAVVRDDGVGSGHDRGERPAADLRRRQFADRRWSVPDRLDHAGDLCGVSFPAGSARSRRRNIPRRISAGYADSAFVVWGCAHRRTRPDSRPCDHVRQVRTHGPPDRC